MTEAPELVQAEAQSIIVEDIESRCADHDWQLSSYVGLWERIIGQMGFHDTAEEFGRMRDELARKEVEEGTTELDKHKVSEKLISILPPALVEAALKAGKERT